jgi:5-methylcytosine-specific restriction endonuclease McrA
VSSYQYRKAHWSAYRGEKRKGRQGRPYKRWRAKVLEPKVLVCCRCGRLIDKALSGNHPWGPTADHYPVPLSRWAGDPLDLRNSAPAHRRCNLSAQNLMPGELPVHAPTVADRRW